jgi:hypothetical protein
MFLETNCASSLEKEFSTTIKFKLVNMNMKVLTAIPPLLLATVSRVGKYIRKPLSTAVEMSSSPCSIFVFGCMLEVLL